jgi:hypothetical protein
MSEPHPANVYVAFAEKLKADLDAFLKNKESSRICVGKSGGLMRLRGPFS